MSEIDDAFEAIVRLKPGEKYTSRRIEMPLQVSPGVLPKKDESIYPTDDEYRLIVKQARADAIKHFCGEDKMPDLTAAEAFSIAFHRQCMLWRHKSTQG